MTNPDDIPPDFAAMQISFHKAQAGYIIAGILIYFLTSPITGPVMSLDLWEILMLIAVLGWVVYQLIKDVWLNPMHCRNLVKQIIEKKIKERRIICFVFSCFGIYPYLVLVGLYLISEYFPEYFYQNQDIIKGVQILFPAGLNLLCMKFLSEK